MCPDQPYHRLLDDFHPGQTFEHWPRKTVTEADNHLFCLLTMNHNPLHLDAEYAAKQGHGRILVAGPYVLALAVGLSVPDLSGACLANLEYESVVHHAPVFHGDTIGARSRVLAVTPSASKPDRGVVTVETEAYNQRGETVLTLRRKILIPRELPPGVPG
ncbi:MAG: MaoC family dehydratase [Candidatus Zixiibacteriota bacterium]|nr:MAG: MaoC family dehydratase [candidate division Zixibacteria bacterium]